MLLSSKNNKSWSLLELWFWGWLSKIWIQRGFISYDRNVNKGLAKFFAKKSLFYFNALFFFGFTIQRTLYIFSLFYLYFLKISNCHTLSLLTPLLPSPHYRPPPWLTPPQPLPQLNPSKSLVEVIRSHCCWPSHLHLSHFHWIWDCHHHKKHHCTILASLIH